MENKMEPEEKLLFAVLLNALIEQDPKKVRTQTEGHSYYKPSVTNKERRQHYQQAKAKEAVEYINSPDFRYICSLLSINPRLLAKVTSDQAAKELRRILGKHGARTGLFATLQEAPLVKKQSSK